MAPTWTWRGGFNANGAGTAVVFNEYLLSAVGATGFPTVNPSPVGIWNRNTNAYRVFQYQFPTGFSDRTLALIVQDGSPMYLGNWRNAQAQGGGQGLRINPAAGTITEVFTHTFDFRNTSIGGRPTTFLYNGKHWGVTNFAITGWQYPSTYQTITPISNGAIYGWFFDAPFLYTLHVVGGVYRVAQTNLQTETVVTVWPNEFGSLPPPFSSSGNGNFVRIGSTFYWGRADGMLSWTPGSAAFLIPRANSSSPSLAMTNPEINGSSIVDVYGDALLVVDPLTANGVGYSLPAGIRPANRSVGNPRATVIVNGKRWFATNGTG